MLLKDIFNKKDKKREITWYCPHTWEPWSPKSLDKGVAGSQTAVIYLSKEWAKLGHKVKVYNNCGSEEGIYEGVEYIDYKKFDKKKVYDILILWRERSLGLLDNDIKAKKIFLELQDFPFRSNAFNEKQIKKVDKLFMKSRFHASFFKNIPKNKIIIIPNGVDLKYLDLKNKKDSNRLIYASNYHRGIEHMLKYGWPIIKKEIPDAKLDIYYGWGQLDFYKKDKEEYQKWKKMLLKLIKESPGVNDKGRISQEELMKEKSKSSIHYYGCIWPETDCISVRESALVGCVPVTSNYSAIGEKPYCIRVKGDPKQKETQEKIAHKIVKLMKNPKKLDRLRKKVSRLAAKDGWSVIAKRWLREFV